MFERDQFEALRNPDGLEWGIDSLAQYVQEWADSVFPHRTAGSMALKLYSEIGEMLRDPKDAGEVADVFIMLLDFARSNGHHNIGALVDAKLEINRKRTWKINPDGVMSHVSPNSSDS